MTGSAIRCKVLLALFEIASLEIRRVHAASASLLALHFGLLAMDKRNDGGHVHLRQIEPRHAFLRPTVANHFADLIAFHVFANQLRTRQIGPAFATSGFRAMTKSALLPK